MGSAGAALDRPAPREVPMSQQQQVEQGDGVSWRMILGIVALVLAVVLIAQNSQDAPVHVLWMNVTMPLWVLLAVTFALGGLTGWLLKARRVKRAR